MLVSNIDSADRINEAIQAIRICIENHEQSPDVVARVLSGLSRVVNAEDQFVLDKVSRVIKDSNYRQSSHDRWKNPLGRRFESQLQIELLTHPTNAMMQSVYKISSKIVEILDKNPDLQLRLMHGLTEKAHIISFGSFKACPQYGEIRDVLISNDPKKLAEIMHVHFKFSQGFARALKGEYESIAHEIKQVADIKMYQSEYYHERGRGEAIKYHFTNRMGLLTADDGIYNQSLPKHSSRWVADAKAQPPNLSSPFTQDLIENDTPYVAGPSGMTSMFVGQMLGFDVHESKGEQQCYIAAVTAYMVSGGFHSLHEVLGPIAMCLSEERLIPGYQVSMPQKDVLSAPSNYHVFYRMMEGIDPQFSLVRQAGWRHLEAFFRNEYLKQAKHLRSCDTIGQSIKDAVILGVTSYEGRSKGFFSYTLNPDKRRGQIRSQSYKRMLVDAKSPLQQLVITFALFVSRDGSTLQSHVAKELGFNKVGTAKNFIESEIHRVLHGLISTLDMTGEEKGRKYDGVIASINNALKLIVRAANSKEIYTSANRGEFEKPLSGLEQIERELICSRPSIMGVIPK